MAAAINDRRPFHVKAIQFSDGQTLEDRTVFVAGEFLIVEAQGEDQAPTWYNLRSVEVLQEVSIEGNPGGSVIHTMRLG